MVLVRPIERESSPSVFSARAFATGKTMFCERTVVMATVVACSRETSSDWSRAAMPVLRLANFGTGIPRRSKFRLR